jgi:hypothetical protein
MPRIVASIDAGCQGHRPGILVDKRLIRADENLKAIFNGK